MKNDGIIESSDHVKTIRYGTFLPQIERLERIQPFPDERPEGFVSSTEHYTFCYSARGWQTWYVGKQYCYLPRGHFLLVKPGTFFSRGDRASGDSRIFLLAARAPDVESPDPYLGFGREEWRRLFSLINDYAYPVVRVSEELPDLWERIYRFSEESLRGGRDLLDKIRLQNMYRELIYFLASGTNVFSNPLDTLIDSILPRLPKGGYSPMIEKAIGQMSENLYSGLTLVSLADGVDISLSRFKARFLEETGMAPLDYFTRLSVQKSLELLHTTSRSVRSIAEELGFSSSPYFSRVFRNTVGMGPEEFRAWKGR